ncbi:hypothetical protein [Sorangium sp. So ce861]|uniref:hypothetical protein n=1 Tax=Sorangium sp. So ce861 TaxID=3133323 RepID=UPI003F5FB701
MLKAGQVREWQQMRVKTPLDEERARGRGVDAGQRREELAGEVKLMSNVNGL